MDLEIEVLSGDYSIYQFAPDSENVEALFNRQSSDEFSALARSADEWTWIGPAGVVESTGIVPKAKGS